MVGTVISIVKGSEAVEQEFLLQKPDIEQLFQVISALTVGYGWNSYVYHITKQQMNYIIRALYQHQALVLLSKYNKKQICRQ